MEELRVLVCGSRSWTNREPIERELEKLTATNWVEPSAITVIHGAARGADSMAGEIAQQLGYRVIGCPAEWNRYGRAAGPIRNQHMLTAHVPQLVLAFASDLTNSTGTAHMIGIARRAGIEVQHFRN